MNDKILIVEDDAILAVHLKKILTLMNYEVLGFVASGEEAVRFAIDLVPDLILMDIRLKGKLTGIEAATKINESLNIPIIFLTAYTDQNVLSQIKTAASYGYLSKPVRDTELKASIDIAIYKNRTDKTLKRLNEILRASKAINKLITTEKVPINIYTKACEILISSKEYSCVCFAKQTNQNNIEYITSLNNKNLKTDLSAKLLQLLQTENTFLQDKKAAKNIHFTFDNDENPQKLFLLESNLTSAIGAAIPLLHSGQNFGLMIVVNKNNEIDNEENELLQEISSDIAFALWSISEAKKKEIAEMERSIFYEAVKQSSALILITDIEANIVFVNPAITEITGYSPKELIGKNPRLLKPEDRDNTVYKDFWAALTSGKQYQIEFKNKKKNGDYYWASAVVGPIKNSAGETTHYFGIQQDITKSKELEFELKLALERAKEISTLKSNLLGNLNHEVRTPMNAIIGFSQILKEEIKDEALADMADKISKSSYRLLNTLSLILDLSELESGTVKVSRTKIVLSNFINYILSALKITAREKNLTFEVIVENEELTAPVDERLLTQILKNIVENAIKYTEEGGITITIKEGMDENNIPSAFIEIQDTGEGITKEALKIIFDEFRQASEGITRKYQGTGLGLTIAKKMMNLLNGKIKVESKVGKGSTFTLILPLELEDEKLETASNIFTKHPRKNQKPFPPKPKIFVAEDNNLNVEVLKHFIKDIAEMDYALNAKNALEKISQNRYDILLFDIKLEQGVDGVELMRLVRKLPNYKNTPIVAITGYTESGDEANFIKMGFTHYLAKPFSKSQIVELVQKIIQA